LGVTGGGAVSFDRADFVTSAGSSVAVTVDGAGTTWSSKGFTLGGGGTASFTASGGASVDTGNVEVVVNGTGATTPNLIVSGGASFQSLASIRIGTTNS